mgnify:CR=1 FL=1
MINPIIIQEKKQTVKATKTYCTIKNTADWYFFLLKNTRYYIIKFKSKMSIMNQKDSNGDTALHLSMKKGDLDMVTSLVENGADVNLRNNHGDSPLLIATFFNHLEAVKYLLKKGAGINLPNLNGVTPLHIASIQGNVEIVKFLLASGADLSATCNDTPTIAPWLQNEIHPDL